MLELTPLVGVFQSFACFAVPDKLLTAIRSRLSVRFVVQPAAKHGSISSHAHSFAHTDVRADEPRRCGRGRSPRRRWRPDALQDDYRGGDLGGLDRSQE